MELDELKRTWLDFEQRIDRQLAARDSRDKDVWQQRQRDRIRRGLWPLFWGQIAQIAFGVVLILMAVAYWSANLGVSYRMLVGVLIHVYGVIVIMLSGITLGRMSRIDYTDQVVMIQQRLAGLRRWCICCGAIVGLPWWFMWMPFMHVVFGLLGADFLGNVSPLFLWCNIGAGILGLLATLVFHRWLHQPGREQLANRFDDSAAGTGLTRVRNLLADLESSDIA